MEFSEIDGRLAEEYERKMEESLAVSFSSKYEYRAPKIHIQLITVTTWIPDKYGFQRVESCPVSKWSGFEMDH